MHKKPIEVCHQRSKRQSGGFELPPLWEWDSLRNVVFFGSAQTHKRLSKPNNAVRINIPSSQLQDVNERVAAGLSVCMPAHSPSAFHFLSPIEWNPGRSRDSG
jgi:hypothetical protein